MIDDIKKEFDIDKIIDSMTNKLDTSLLMEIKAQNLTLKKLQEFEPCQTLFIYEYQTVQYFDDNKKFLSEWASVSLEHYYIEFDCSDLIDDCIRIKHYIVCEYLKSLIQNVLFYYEID